MRKWRFARTPQISDWVPWEDWLNERTVLLADGSACAWLEVEGGRSPDTANAHDLNAWHAEINHALRQVASDRLIYSTVLCHGIHGPEVLPEEPCGLPFVAGLRREYRANLLRNTLYFNRLYIVLQYRPATSGAEWIGERVMELGAPKNEPAATDSAADRLAQVERIAALLTEQLRGFRLRRLGMRMSDTGMINEIAQAQVFASTGVWREIHATTGRMGNAMFSEDLTFHYEHIELRQPGGTTYAAHLGFREYPAVTGPMMFAGLLAANFRFTLHQSFRCMEQSEGQKIIGRKQNFMRWSGDKAFEQRDGLTQAANDLQGGRFVMGDHNMTLAVFSDRLGGGGSLYDRLLDAFRRAHLPSLADGLVEGVVDSVLGGPNSNGLTDVVNAAWRALAASGCVVARENRGIMAAWLSMIAGNHQYRVRPGAISSRNYAAMNPLHSFAGGPGRSRWGKPIAITRNAGGGPYGFHWHDGEGDSAVGNTLITGETGSGKSVGTGFLLANTAAALLPQGGGIIALDHKRGWHALFLAMGGSYSVLGAGEPHFAPLKALDDTPRDREFLYDLLVGCIRHGGWRDLHTDEERRLALGIATVMQNPREHREVREVQAFLGDEEDSAGARLRKWCWGEDLGWVIDAPQDHVDFSGGLNGYDTTLLMQNKRARGAAMAYLFYRIERRLNGAPLVIPIDEGWYVLMEDGVFAPAIQKSARTIRSKNGVLVFITQSPEDAVRSGMTAALIEQFPNQIHFANPRASRGDYVDGLKRTEGEFEALMSLQKGSGQFLLCKGRDSSLQQLPLAGMQDELAILSTNEESLEAIDLIPLEVQRDPVRFVAEYHRLRRKVAADRQSRRQLQETHP